MYIIKSGDLYFDGVGLTASQKHAKRFYMDRPTDTFRSYLDVIFDNGARFVKLTGKRSAVGFDDADWDDADFTDDWGF